MHGGRWPEMVVEWMSELISRRCHPELFLRHPSPSCFEISLPGSEKSIRIKTDRGVFWKNSGVDMPCTGWRPDIKVPGCPDDLVMPGWEKVPEQVIRFHDDRIELEYDIPGLAFWMMSRCEEVFNQERDSHCRFPASASHAWRHAYLDRPVVDEWMLLLKALCKRVWPQLPLVQPHFRTVPSHDVDFPSRYAFATLPRLIRYMAADVLKNRDFLSALMAPWIRLTAGDRLHPKDPFNCFDWIMDESEARGLVSTFYFICGRTNPVYDSDYEPEHPAIGELIRRIKDRGHDVGLHPSYDTWLNESRIRDELQRLASVCAREGIDQKEFGARMHFLRFQVPETLVALEGAGIRHDSSLGYADATGFRCGTCIPYRAIDPEAKRAIGLEIRPLVAMERCVIDADRMGLGLSGDASRNLSRLKERCRAVGGDFTILWHNSSLVRAAERQLYLGALDR